MGGQSPPHICIELVVDTLGQAAIDFDSNQPAAIILLILYTVPNPHHILCCKLHRVFLDLTLILTLTLTLTHI